MTDSCSVQTEFESFRLKPEATTKTPGSEDPGATTYPPTRN